MISLGRWRGAAIVLRLLVAVTAVSSMCGWAQSTQSQARVIEILADHDSRYKIKDQKQPVITVICSQDHEGMNMRFVVLP